ncbi:unnamed protein product [Sphagnum jensenii]|uniref:Uncharacterized protein n=1 Tax=Sphagnum jensenii TaxID=128206 RepID=A0ABP0WCA8_9BRYO
MEAADSILPPLDSRPCEIMYLSILEMAAPDPDLPLSKVTTYGFHKGALSLEVRAAKTLITVSVTPSVAWSLTNCARPSTRIPCRPLGELWFCLEGWQCQR